MLDAESFLLGVAAGGGGGGNPNSITVLPKGTVNGVLNTLDYDMFKNSILNNSATFLFTLDYTYGTGNPISGAIVKSGGNDLLPIFSGIAAHPKVFSLPSDFLDNTAFFTVVRKDNGTCYCPYFFCEGHDATEFADEDEVFSLTIIHHPLP